MATSSLTLVGVGPGDPSLLTLAAVQAIQKATVVAYPVSRQGDDGIAATIAASWITQEKKRLPLLFPMISEPLPRKEAWRNAGDQIASLVAEGEEVVFLCQGDVSLFASASYIMLYIKASHKECPIRLIPGISAVSAAAAAAALPLALQNDQLLVLPTPDDSSRFESLISEASCSGRVLAFMKLGSRWNWVRPLLEEKGLLENTFFAQRVGFSDQEVMVASNVPAGIRPYFSLLIIRQSWPEVMP